MTLSHQCYLLQCRKKCLTAISGEKKDPLTSNKAPNKVLSGLSIWAAQEKRGKTERQRSQTHLMWWHAVFALSGVRTLGPCSKALIYPSSITDVSAVIYELWGAGWWRKGWDLAGGGLRPHGWVMVGDRAIVLCMGWGNNRTLRTGAGVYRKRGGG